MVKNATQVQPGGLEELDSGISPGAIASGSLTLSLPRRDYSEAWTRFQDLVMAAVDLFNKGSLKHGALLLELADRWQAEHRFDPMIVELVRDRLGHSLQLEKILQHAEKTDDRRALRSALGCFSALAPDALLEALRLEPRRECRRRLLLLLEARGEPARSAASSRLREAIGRAPDAEEWHFRRNLLHLLRRIPRPGTDSFEQEIELGVCHSRLGLPSHVVKEAVGLLGQIQDDRAEFALIRLLRELEDMVPGRDFFSETRNLAAVADRVAAALAAFPTRRARSAIVNYAERIHMECGRAMSALAGLSRHDLSGDEATVDRLIGLLRRGQASGFSRRLLARRTSQDHQDMVPVIESLSGTRLPVVRRTLEQIVARYPKRCSGVAAARALADLARRRPSVNRSVLDNSGA